MVPLTSLLVPILVSAVLVFLASFVIHMALTYHRNDYRKVPSEDAFMDALRKFDIAPGDYLIPHAGTAANSRSPEFKEKFKRGPVAVMTVMRGDFNMGSRFAQWFGYLIVVGVFAGYIAGRALPRGAHYLAVFRFAGCTAFVAYGLALWQNSIWYSRSWATTMRSTIDALIYGLLTAGVFGWLWPR